MESVLKGVGSPVYNVLETLVTNVPQIIFSRMENAQLIYLVELTVNIALLAVMKKVVEAVRFARLKIVLLVHSRNAHLASKDIIWFLRPLIPILLYLASNVLLIAKFVKVLNIVRFVLLVI